MKWTEQDSVDLSAALVVLDGHRIPLDEQEQIAAVRIGVAAGMDWRLICERLGRSQGSFRQWCKDRGVVLPALPLDQRRMEWRR